MLIVVQINISNADLRLFEDYEAKVLPLLGGHGGRLVERLRATDGRSEIHLLQFPDASSFEAFRTDPTRAGLQDIWRRCSATSVLTEVARLT